jgi:pSer/pThr/pTyr-binding forkhead associated (FHA) protein
MVFASHLCAAAMALRQQNQREAVMGPTITLIVTRGPLAGQKFVFTEETSCVIGRSRDCTIVLPQEVEHLDVSRHHCLLEIAPPILRIRDLGSLNGTFVNGRKIGQRITSRMNMDVNASHHPAVVLSDGDEFQLGEHTAFRVCIFTPESEDTVRKPRRSSGELHFEAPIHS